MNEGTSTLQPNPGERVSHDHVKEHEIGLLADQILEEARRNYGNNRIGEDEFQKAVHYASDIAQAHVKYGRSGGVDSARAAVRAAAASAIAPEFKAERDEAERAARTDFLTGLANPAALNEALFAAELDPTVCVISFDGDNFGLINKLHHQPAGDAAIIALADAILKAAVENGTNRVFRGGGDEFYVLASPNNAEAIIDDAQRLLGERINSGVPLSDSQGDQYPAVWYLELGVSGASAQTRAEADIKMQQLKQDRKKLHDMQ